MDEPTRPIEYYQELLEVNDKWLGTQAHDMLLHYAELEGGLAQTRERVKRLEAALLEARIELEEPWDNKEDE